MIIARPVPTAGALLDLDAPELACLGALEHLLAATCAAIEAANPELLFGDDLDRINRVSLPRLWSADDIREHSHALVESIRRYRHALHVAADTSDDASKFPF